MTSIGPALALPAALALLMPLAACGGETASDSAPSDNSAPAEASARPQSEGIADDMTRPDAAAGRMAAEELTPEELIAALREEVPPMQPAPVGLDMRSDFIGLDGEVIGEALMTDGPNGLLFRLDIEGLTEGFHGSHLHRIGDCSDPDDGFQASGGHVNPGGVEHGLMNPNGYAPADLANLYVHITGHARAEKFAPGLEMETALDDDGFAIIVHENQDDLRSQPIGGAGARVACAAFTMDTDGSAGDQDN